jgi:hypothetical protein
MAALCQYRFAIERLTGLKPTTEDRQIFTFSDSATKYRAAVVEICECVQRLPDTPDALKAHLNKFEAAFCRIALIFHLIESAHLDQPPGLRISEQTARMAARLITDFLLPNSIRFYHETIDTGSHNAHAKWVANYILSKGVAEVVRSQLVRDYRPFFKTPNLLDHTLRTLETCGWVEPSKTKKAGTVTRWKVNPRAHEKFVERAKEEAERRKNERLKIQKAAQKLRMSRKGADHVND